MAERYEPFDWYEDALLYDIIFEADTRLESDFLETVSDLHGRGGVMSRLFCKINFDHVAECTFGHVWRVDIGYRSAGMPGRRHAASFISSRLYSASSFMLR